MKEAKELIVSPNPSDPTAATFHAKPISYEQLAVRVNGHELRTLLRQPDGSLLETHCPVKTFDGYQEADPDRDLLKLVWIHGGKKSAPALAFVQGVGMKMGAVAMSRSLDSHDVVAVGVTDFELEEAINAVIRVKGGVAVACLDEVQWLPRPKAPLSEEECKDALRRYAELEQKAKRLKSPLPALLDQLLMLGGYDVPNLSSRLFR